MNTKYFMTFGFLALCAVCVSSESISWGARHLGDRLLARRIVKAEAKRWRIVTTDYKFEQTGAVYPARISQIVVHDPLASGEGGKTSITRGGPKQTFVELHIKSKRSKGIHLIIDIFGR